MAIKQITTHEQDSIDQLLLQYKDKAVIEGLVKIFGKQIQELENVYCDMLEKRTLDEAFGTTQDLMGTIVGQDRQGFDDTFYENLLKAKVGENTSQGDIEKIIDITRLLTNASLIELQEWYPQGIGLGVNVAVDPSLINFFYERLNRVDVATVRVEGIWCFDDTEGFAFDGGPGTAEGFGDINDANTGGTLAELHIRTQPAFSFAAQAGVEDGDEGFSSIEDVYAGGILQGI